MYTDYLRNLDHEGVAFDVPIGMSRHCRPGSGPVTDVFLSYHRPTGDTQPRTSSICWSDPGRGEREVGRRAFMATPWRPRHRFWVPSAATTTARKARKAVTAAGACRPATTGRGADDELSELDPLVCLLGGNTLVVVPAELVLQPDPCRIDSIAFLGGPRQLVGHVISRWTQRLHLVYGDAHHYPCRIESGVLRHVSEGTHMRHSGECRVRVCTSIKTCTTAFDRGKVR